MKEEIIIREADEYIQNDLSILDTAKKLGISRRTLQLHLKALEGIDFRRYQLVLDKKKSNELAGRKMGAAIGKRGPTFTKDEAIFVAKKMVAEQMTYEEASIRFDMPTSTIYEMVHSSYISQELLDMLNIVADANRRGITIMPPFSGQSHK